MSKDETAITGAKSASEIDADHFDYLFEIASRDYLSPEQIASLDEADKEQIDGIRSVLSHVNAQLPVTTEDLEDIDAAFLKLLAEEEPDHPWVSAALQLDTDEVELKTVGDMVRLVNENSPAEVPQNALDFLFRSPRPISDLVDTARRPTVLGPLFKEAGIPPLQIPAMCQWVNVGMNSLAAGQNGVFVGRRQRKKPNPPR